MGRYVHGTQNFNYKYVFAAQPTNLNQLAAWAGFGQQDEAFSLSAQLYLPHDEAHEQTMQQVVQAQQRIVWTQERILALIESDLKIAHAKEKEVV